MTWPWKGGAAGGLPLNYWGYWGLAGIRRSSRMDLGLGHWRAFEPRESSAPKNTEGLHGLTAFLYTQFKNELKISVYCVIVCFYFKSTAL